MGLILDTSVFIEAERRHIDFNEWLHYDQAYISIITMTELLVGVHRANTQDRQLKRSAFVEHIIQSIKVLSYQQEEARIHAQLLSHLLQKGLTIGAHDLMIGATALVHGYPILTKNTIDFTRIPGVEVLALVTTKS